MHTNLEEDPSAEEEQRSTPTTSIKEEDLADRGTTPLARRRPDELTSSRRTTADDS